MAVIDLGGTVLPYGSTVPVGATNYTIAQQPTAQPMMTNSPFNGGGYATPGAAPSGVSGFGMGLLPSLYAQATANPTVTGDSTFSANVGPDVTANTTIPGGTSDIISNLPALRGAMTSGESKIDPSLLPYLQMGLQRAEQLFFGQPQPSMYPEQMYVSPSQQTLEALSAQENIARQGMAPLEAGQQAYAQSLGQIGQTAAGGFLQGSPYQQAAIEAATRPLQQQFAESTLPAIQSAFSKAGRYGSGAQTRAIGQAQEATSRAMGDVAANIAYQDYARERGIQQQAIGQQAALGALAPQFYQSQMLPAQTLGQVGAAQEAIQAQPLQEAIQRYQFQQQLPYQQLQTYLSSVYGTPLASSVYPTQPQAQTNQLGQAIGGAGLGYLAGNWLGGSTGGVANSTLGAVGGGLLGYFL